MSLVRELVQDLLESGSVTLRTDEPQSSRDFGPMLAAEGWVDDGRGSYSNMRYPKFSVKFSPNGLLELYDHKYPAPLQVQAFYNFLHLKEWLRQNSGGK